MTAKFEPKLSYYFSVRRMKRNRKAHAMLEIIVEPIVVKVHLNLFASSFGNVTLNAD